MKFKSKFYTLSLLSLLTILSGCQYFPSSSTSSDEINSVEVTSDQITDESESIDSQSNIDPNSTQTELEEDPTEDISENEEESSNSLFGETVVGDSNYPTSSVMPEIDRENLYYAIENYYLHEFSTDEKEANKSRVSKAVLAQLQEQLQANPQLEPLELEVDQVEFELAGNTVYVARVIVPMAYKQAEELVPENDYFILNETLGDLPNRLVFISYYNPTTDQVTPVHLANSNHSLFYYDPLMQTID